jgi:hypothetical protein
VIPSGFFIRDARFEIQYIVSRTLHPAFCVAHLGSSAIASRIPRPVSGGQFPPK